jgi:mitofilin
LVFYPTSAYLSLQSDKYRDFFTSTFPLAEQLIEYADDNDWDQYGLSTLTGGAGSGATQRPTTTGAANSTRDMVAEAREKAKDLRNTIAQKADTLAAQASKKLDEAKHAASAAVSDVKKETKQEAASLERTASDSTEKVKNEARRTVDNLKAVASSATQAVKEKASQVASEVNSLHFSDGVSELVDRAEHALGRAETKAENALRTAEAKVGSALHNAEAKAENALHNAETKVENVAHDLKAASNAPVPAGVQAQMVDTQPKRDVVADDSHKVVNKAYNGPALPIGFEPPPGYYVPKPVEPKIDSGKKELAADPLQAGLPEPKPVLPLLAPKVHEFTSAQDEPIISQLASTIDSLAESLSATSSAAGSTSTTDSASPAAILTRAQDDLSSLSTRLQALKDEEKAKLEQTAESKRREFEAQLKAKESEWTNKEGELLEGWKEEREKLVEGWRKVLDRELEGQRVGIEQR